MIWGVAEDWDKTEEPGADELLASCEETGPTTGVDTGSLLQPARMVSSRIAASSALKTCFRICFPLYSQKSSQFAIMSTILPLPWGNCNGILVTNSLQFYSQSAPVSRHCRPKTDSFAQSFFYLLVFTNFARIIESFGAKGPSVYVGGSHGIHGNYRQSGI